MPAIERHGDTVYVRVRVQPKASRTALETRDDGSIRVALTTPPVDGAANEALCVYLSKICAVPKRTVSLVSGQKSRDKVIAISGITVEEVQAAVYGT